MSLATQRGEKRTIDFALTDRERHEFRLALKMYVTDLRMRISHTDRYEFREDLKAKRAVLEEVLRRLGGATPAAGEQERQREAR
jgi:hypothetical protein